MTEYSITKFSMRQCPVTEYFVGLVPLFLANTTPNKVCGVSYHRKPQAFPYNQVPMTLQWCCMEVISPCFERVTPLGFLACHHAWRKMADGRAATVRTVFYVYSLIKCLCVRLCLWSVCHPYFLLLFAPVVMIWQMQWCQPKKPVPQNLLYFSR